MDSESFYDSYVDRQLRVGVNERHRSILGFLKRWGMRQGDRVLEIGSGVGTLTGLIAAELDGRGRLVGMDLSPRSIEAARERLSRWDNVELVVGDALDVELDGPFDVIVLPDVIEHIPQELHHALFGRVADWVTPEGFVLVHYPDPLWLTWCQEHRPELLQHIDQPIHADALTAAVHPHGLLLRHMETYSIWVEEGDYQVAILRRRRPDATFTVIEPDPPTLLQRAGGKLRRVVRKVARDLLRESR